MKYKVAMPYGRWKYGFDTLESAIAYEALRRARTGVYASIEAYKPRTKHT
jgi:hypothetical protein